MIKAAIKEHLSTGEGRNQHFVRRRRRCFETDCKRTIKVKEH